MDNLSHLALGAAIGMAVMGRRTAAWKAALWGGVCANLPDLDVFIAHGDAIADMTLHRGNSHALFWLTLAAPPIAWLIARLHDESALFGRWALAVWLALITHPLLDVMTVYGTQLLRPFTDQPYGLGSIFIIDPLFTLPLLACVIAALRAGPRTRRRWSTAGLVLGSAYLGWGALAQQHATAVARASLQAQGLAVQRLLVTPTPFNSLLWRVLAITPDGHVEGFYSLLDRERHVAFERHARGEALIAAHQGDAQVQRIAWFSRGFYKMQERDDLLRITDLRMGQEPRFFFNFVIAQRQDGAWTAVVPRQQRETADVRRALPWLWRRMLGEALPPPR